MDELEALVRTVVVGADSPRIAATYTYLPPEGEPR